VRGEKEKRIQKREAFEKCWRKFGGFFRRKCMRRGNIGSPFNQLKDQNPGWGKRVLPQNWRRVKCGLGKKRSIGPIKRF